MVPPLIRVVTGETQAKGETLPVLKEFPCHPLTEGFSSGGAGELPLAMVAEIARGGAGAVGAVAFPASGLLFAPASDTDRAVSHVTS